MKTKVFEILDELKVDYENFVHNKVHSCNDAKGIEVPGKRAKSLLIRNKKSTNIYMVVLGEEKKLDTNLIRSAFDDSKMSFSSEELMLEKIGLRPGSVSPFALINNTLKDIKVVFDKELKDILIGFHPLQNDNTVVLNMKDIENFLNHLGFSYSYLEL